MSPASGDAMQAAFEKEWVDHHFRLALERYRHGADDRGRRLLASTLAGVPVSAITEELGMSENGVHKAQQRLRDELRRLVAEQVREEDDGHAG